MKEGRKKIKTHQLRPLIAAYEEISHEGKILEKMAEYVARYRFFIMKRSSDSYEHSAFIADFNQIYIYPLIAMLKDRYLLHPLKAQTRIDCIQKILNKMIESVDHNDTWAVSLFVAAYRQSWSWPPYRHLTEEIAIHNIKNLKRRKTVIKFSSNKIPDNFRFNLFNKTLANIKNRKEYLKTHMPHDFNRYLYPKKFLAWFVLLMVFILCVKFVFSKDNFSAVITLLMTPLLLIGQASLYGLFNACLPSYLDLDKLPGSLGLGLLTELKENIDEEIEILRKRLPSKKTVHVVAEVETRLLSNSFVPLTAVPFPPKSDDLFPVPARVKTKQKTHSSQPSLYLSLSLSEAPIIYTWKTKQYGEIKFQPGRVSDKIFPLWSASKRFDQRFVVLFPRETLAGEEKLITAFWKTARVGRIVHPKEQAGYVLISDPEKRNPKYEFSSSAIFKIKTPPHSEYGAYRQAVSPCEVEDSKADDIQLLCAESPVKIKNH